MREMPGVVDLVFIILMLSIRVLDHVSSSLVKQNNLGDKIWPEEWSVESRPDSRACSEKCDRSLRMIFPVGGPLRVNELPDRAAILREDDPPGFMIDALDEAAHRRAPGASRLGAGKGAETREQRGEAENERDCFHSKGCLLSVGGEDAGFGHMSEGLIVCIFDRGGRGENANPAATAVLLVASAFGAMADRETGFSEQVGIVV